MSLSPLCNEMYAWQSPVLMDFTILLKQKNWRFWCVHKTFQFKIVFMNLFLINKVLAGEAKSPTICNFFKICSLRLKKISVYWRASCKCWPKLLFTKKNYKLFAQSSLPFISKIKTCNDYFVPTSFAMACVGVCVCFFFAI